MDVNKAILVGRAANDPDVKYTSGGTLYCTLNLETVDEWKTHNGDSNSRTEYHRIVCFGKIADRAIRMVSKGNRVWIDGKIQYRKDSDGVYHTEIIADKVEA